MHQTWLLLLLLGQVTRGAHIKEDPKQGSTESSSEVDAKTCHEQETVNRTVLAGLMLKTGILDEETLQLNHLPNTTYVEFAFLHPVIVKGWTTRGRKGSMFGPIAKRRGFVASYVVTFVDSNGKVAIIPDPDTNDEDIVSEGNLAHPEQVTEVDLDKEIRTDTLRMAPTVWSGVPYMAAKVYFCATPGGSVMPVQKPHPESLSETESTKDVENELKESRTSGPVAAALDASKRALGLTSKDTGSDQTQDKAYQLPYTHCAHPPTWRYAAKPTPVDHFTARGNPQQAWRAIMGLTYTPYLFPTLGPHTRHHRLLEIIFRKRSIVEAVKVGGLGEAGETKGHWGAVTKFSLLYKDTKTENWIYYTDSVGVPRVFTVGNRTRENAHKVGVFHLPVPVKTDAVGFFPHAWANKPYLSVDILACYFKQIGQEPPKSKKHELSAASNETVEEEPPHPPRPIHKSRQKIKKEKKEREEINLEEKEVEDSTNETHPEEKQETRRGHGAVQVGRTALARKMQNERTDTELEERVESTDKEPQPISVEKSEEKLKQEEEGEELDNGRTEITEEEESEVSVSQTKGEDNQTVRSRLKSGRRKVKNKHEIRPKTRRPESRRARPSAHDSQTSVTTVKEQRSKTRSEAEGQQGEVRTFQKKGEAVDINETQPEEESDDTKTTAQKPQTSRVKSLRKMQNEETEQDIEDTMVSTTDEAQSDRVGKSEEEQKERVSTEHEVSDNTEEQKERATDSVEDEVSDNTEAQIEKEKKELGPIMAKLQADVNRTVANTRLKPRWHRARNKKGIEKKKKKRKKKKKNEKIEHERREETSTTIDEQSENWSHLGDVHKGSLESPSGVHEKETEFTMEMSTQRSIANAESRNHTQDLSSESSQLLDEAASVEGAVSKFEKLQEEDGPSNAVEEKEDTNNDSGAGTAKTMRIMEESVTKEKSELVDSRQHEKKNKRNQKIKRKKKNKKGPKQRDRGKNKSSSKRKKDGRKRSKRKNGKGKK